MKWKGKQTMKKAFVVLPFLLLLSGMSQSFLVLFPFPCPFGTGPLELHAAERQKAQQPTDWKSLPPEVQKFILDLGEEEKPKKTIIKMG